MSIQRWARGPVGTPGPPPVGVDALGRRHRPAGSAGPAVLVVRRRGADLLPTRRFARPGAHRARRRHADRLERDAVGRHGAWPAAAHRRHLTGAADRGPLPHRSGHPPGRPPLGRHRRRRHHRAELLRHRPEPRVRRPWRTDRCSSGRPTTPWRSGPGRGSGPAPSSCRGRSSAGTPWSAPARWCGARSPTTRCWPGSPPRSCAATSRAWAGSPSCATCSSTRRPAGRSCRDLQ